MTEDTSTPQDRLDIINSDLTSGFGDVIDMNADLMNATRTMAHNLLTIRQGHLIEADRLLELTKQLAESAHITAELTADTIAAEWGISFDELDEDEEEEEEEE